MVDLYHMWVGEQRAAITFFVSFFPLFFCSEQSIIAAVLVSFFFFFLLSLSVVCLSWSSLCIEVRLSVV